MSDTLFRAPIASRSGRGFLIGAVCLGVALTPATTAQASPKNPSNAAKEAAMHQLQAHAASTNASPAQQARLLHALAGRRAPASVQRAAELASSTPTSVTVTGTSGVLGLGATSSAAYVVFEFDRVAVGSPVAVATGSASTTLASWGYANGSHEVRAADCTSTDPNSCDVSVPATTTVELDNASPIITAPANGGKVTGGFTIHANSAGGGVKFLIDGTRRGFDGTAPYTFTYTGSALTQGTHTITAVQCSSDEHRCSGPSSASVSITSDSLHPKITSISPSTFSPNGDRVKDTAKLTFTLPDTEKVWLTITNSRGTRVRGPGSLGTLRRGTHSWTWNGRSSAKKIVAAGTYRITLNTSAIRSGALVKGDTWKRVVVDTHAPALSHLSASTSVYPYKDGYKDAMVVKFHVNERTRATLTIRDAKRHIVRTRSTVHNAGTVTLSWDGRTSHRHAVPAGRYTWTLKWNDSVANKAHGSTHHVTVSSKKLVTKSATIIRNGDSFYGAGGSDPSCAEARTDLSYYTHGVWLSNSCFLTDQIEVASAFYHVKLPAAVSYTRLRVAVNGFALFYPTSIETGFGVHGGSSDFGIGGLYEISSGSEGWYTIGSINAAKYVSSHHVANIGVAVDNNDAPDDFDIRLVRIYVSYKVLR